MLILWKEGVNSFDCFRWLQAELRQLCFLHKSLIVYSYHRGIVIFSMCNSILSVQNISSMSQYANARGCSLRLTQIFMCVECLIGHAHLHVQQGVQQHKIQLCACWKLYGWCMYANEGWFAAHGIRHHHVLNIEKICSCWNAGGCATIFDKASLCSRPLIDRVRLPTQEGVPQHLIQLLDDCVEIPQLGLIRSLNVHVSGACTLWQWTQQNLQWDSSVRYQEKCLSTFEVI